MYRRLSDTDLSGSLPVNCGMSELDLDGTSITTCGCSSSCARTVPVTCTSTSADCCWVIKNWLLMGKTTTVSHTKAHTNATACGSMTGVTFSGSSAIKIDWNGKSLTGSIPTSFGNLNDLQEL